MASLALVVVLIMTDFLAHKSPVDGFSVSLAKHQTEHPVNDQQLIDAAHLILAESMYTSAEISLAVVDDPTIHKLNRRYLKHDYPTDVLSFVLNESDGRLDGEVIISADTAAAAAAEIGWPATAEQLLYVIHGMLHLVGYRDTAAADKRAMRAAEEKYLRHFGLDQQHQAHSIAAAKSSVPAPEGEKGRAAT
jgi:probable rRNA maturation factor